MKLIAEIGLAHDGYMDKAKQMVDAVRMCDAVKFQTHIAEAESTYDEPFRVRFSDDKTRFDYWKRTEFTLNQWRELKEYVERGGQEFISSPFSRQAVELLEVLGVNTYKVSSGEALNPDTCDAVAETGKPVIISTGLMSDTQIENVIQKFNHYTLLHCTTEYPVRLNRVNINRMIALRRHGCPVGLSDHSGTIYPALMAMALGADVIELHIKIDDTGPDAVASLPPAAFQLLDYARHAFKDIEMPAEHQPDNRMVELFSKSLALREFQPAGTVITPSMVTWKKPGGGLKDILDIKILAAMGKGLVKDKEPTRILRWGDFS